MKWVGYFFIIAVLSFNCSDQQNNAGLARISCNVYGAQGQKLYLITIPAAGEKRKIIDSAIVSNVNDSIIFQVPLSCETTYMLEVKQTLNKFYVIPNTSYIHIQCNNITGKYTIAGSDANLSLQSYKDKQAQMRRSLNRLWLRADSLSKAGPRQATNFNKIKQAITDSITAIKSYAYDYADTTKSTGVFLQVYDDISFEDDYKKALQFLQHAAQRFPNSKEILQLKNDAVETDDIYEKEFQTGDSLPAIQLPDMNGQIYNTAILKGKYYLMDFWSTWCATCVKYEQYKLLAKQEFAGDNFEIVSVAIDDNKVDWLNIIHSQNLNWIQLIDEKMWKGTAVRTLKFDSIPFNFLVAPTGRIIAKGLPPDSIIPVIKRVVIR